MDIISVKDPNNCVNPDLIFSPFQAGYQQVLNRLVPVRRPSQAFMSGVRELLIPLYFNYFDRLSTSTATTLYQQDKIWFFNVFLVGTRDGRLSNQVVGGARALLEISSTFGIELPTGLFDTRLPPFHAGETRPDHIFPADLDADLNQQINRDAIQPENP